MSLKIGFKRISRVFQAIIHARRWWIVIHSIGIIGWSYPKADKHWLMALIKWPLAQKRRPTNSASWTRVVLRVSNGYGRFSHFPLKSRYSSTHIVVGWYLLLISQLHFLGRYSFYVKLSNLTASQSLDHQRSRWFNGLINKAYFVTISCRYISNNIIYLVC